MSFPARFVTPLYPKIWPLRNGNADDFTIALFVILVILLGGWFVGQLPLVGGTLHAFIAVGTAAYFFTYLVKAARAAAEGRLTPSTWVQAGTPAIQMVGWFQRAWVQAGMPAVQEERDPALSVM